MAESSNGFAAATAAKLEELRLATGRDPQNLQGEAVDRLYNIYIGDPADAPKEPTAPFSKQYSERPATVVIRQIEPAVFKLREPIKYQDKGRQFNIPMDDISDLASVPTFLTWLVPRYGQHTMAALLHDHLQDHLAEDKDTPETDPERVTSEQADTIFRQALHYSRVPFLRRWTLWAAVSLRTVFRSGAFGRVAVVAWAGLLAILGIAWPVVLMIFPTTRVLGLPIGVWVLAAWLLPFIGCWLWFRWWRLALISGLALLLIAYACLAAIIVGGSYFLTESIFRRLLRENTALIMQPPPEVQRRK
jgi:Protein of unknown function (DUF1353)